MVMVELQDYGTLRFYQNGYDAIAKCHVDGSSTNLFASGNRYEFDSHDDSW